MPSPTTASAAEGRPGVHVLGEPLAVAVDALFVGGQPHGDDFIDGLLEMAVTAVILLALDVDALEVGKEAAVAQPQGIAAGDLIGVRTTGATTPVPLVATPFARQKSSRFFRALSILGSLAGSDADAIPTARRK